MRRPSPSSRPDRTRWRPDRLRRSQSRSTPPSGRSRRTTPVATSFMRFTHRWLTLDEHRGIVGSSSAKVCRVIARFAKTSHRRVRSYSGTVLLFSLTDDESGANNEVSYRKWRNGSVGGLDRERSSIIAKTRSLDDSGFPCHGCSPEQLLRSPNRSPKFSGTRRVHLCERIASCGEYGRSTDKAPMSAGPTPEPAFLEAEEPRTSRHNGARAPSNRSLNRVESQIASSNGHQSNTR